MAKTLFSLLILVSIAFPKRKAVHQSSDVYTASYIIEMLPTVSNINIDSSNNPNNIPEDVLKKIVSDKKFTGGFKLRKDLLVKNDSCKISISPFDNNRVQLYYRNYVFTNGKLFKISPSTNEYLKDTAEYKGMAFTGSTKKIKEYLCREMKDVTQKLTIWVCNELPAILNPGINTQVSGAILEYRIETKHSTAIGTITSLEKTKINT